VAKFAIVEALTKSGAGATMALRVQPLSIVDAIAEDIRRNLFSGALRSGTQLTEADVATSYDVARPTAKAAIEKLVAAGLLLRDVHKTARVPAMGPDDVRDLYFSRLWIESEAVRKLAARKIVPDTVLKAHHDVLALQQASAVEVTEPIVGFHSAIVSALGSQRMTRLFRNLMGEMRLCMANANYRHLLHPEIIAEEHRIILEQITVGNAEAAVAALAAHLSQAESRLVPWLEKELSPSKTEASTGSSHAI
jgi:DNA-binding GntR family transcriptional regulator